METPLPNLLKPDAGSRILGSRSRDLGNRLEPRRLAGTPGGTVASADLVAPCLAFLLGFLGIEDIRSVTVEAGPPQAHAEIDALPV